MNDRTLPGPRLEDSLRAQECEALGSLSLRIALLVVIPALTVVVIPALHGLLLAPNDIS